VSNDGRFKRVSYASTIPEATISFDFLKMVKKRLPCVRIKLKIVICRLPLKDLQHFVGRIIIKLNLPSEPTLKSRI